MPTHLVPSAETSKRDITTWMHFLKLGGRLRCEQHEIVLLVNLDK
jgi:hypothetical protein